MPFFRGSVLRTLAALLLVCAGLFALAQGGNSGALRGTVADPSGAVIPGAAVHLGNDVSGLDRSVTTDALGQFEFVNLPFNTYRLAVSADGAGDFSASPEFL